MIRRTFDKSFFERYYARPGTAVVTEDDVWRLAAFVVSYLEHLQVPVRTVLDAGCGIGLWRRALRRLGRTVEYTGIDTSEYLCERYGWARSSIAAFKSRRKFDLIVCQDVLQYVDDGEVRKSLKNVARLCRGALYIDVPTREDVKECSLDLCRTDKRVHLRSVSWYRRLLSPHFISAGGGVFIPRTSSTIVLALERC